MKTQIKTILMLSMLIGISTSSFAQEFRSGVKGGFNFSNLYIDDVDDRKIRTGFHVGIFGQSKISEVTALQMELLYTTKGSESEYNAGPFNGTATFNLGYIEVPILLNIKAADIFEIHFGPSFGFLVQSKIDTEGTFTGSDNLDRDNFKTMDTGIALGVGFNFDDLQIGARFTKGLTEIADSNSSRSLIGNAKNAVGQVYVALGL